MTREIYNFTSTLELENYINELRMAHARSYLADKIDLRQVTKDDLIAIYACLEIKDKEKFKKRLDEIKKM